MAKIENVEARLYQSGFRRMFYAGTACPSVSKSFRFEQAFCSELSMLGRRLRGAINDTELGILAAGSEPCERRRILLAQTAVPDITSDGSQRAVYCLVHDGAFRYPGYRT